MNKEFRVWEPLNKNMHYMNFALYLKADGFDAKRFALPSNEQWLHGSYAVMNLDALEIMQNTGLYDKYGIAIYEKDIIETHGQKLVVNKGMHVYDSRDELVGGLSREVYGYYLESPCGSWQLNIAVELDKLEAIGNIYENPELIK